MSENFGPGLSAVEIVPIHVLLPADSPRSAGGGVRHVRSPSERGTPPPPVIVHRSTMRVVDGVHRLRAAASRGEETVRVRFLEGDEGDAFAEEPHPRLRRIARQAGASPGTVRDARDRPRRGEAPLQRSLPSASLPPD